MENFSTEEIQDFVSKAFFDEKIILSKNSSWPKISIVTISYNQGEFIERTILSVLNQNYPNLEYIIIDGNSTDDSVEVIKKYEKYLAYFISEKDNGTTDALNKGLLKSTGHIIGTQCSDDIYLPRALFKAVEFYKKHPDTNILFGNRLDVDVQDNIIGEGRFTPFWTVGSFYDGMAVSVQSLFFKKTLLSKIGMFDTGLDYANDHEFYIRAGRNKVKFKHVRYYFGAIRRHKAARTYIHLSPQMSEAISIINKMHNYKNNLAPFLKTCSLIRRFMYYFIQGDWGYIIKGIKRRI
jgi:glycosyltransferase involved in cell wall biosynthesis